MCLFSSLLMGSAVESGGEGTHWGPRGDSSPWRGSESLGGDLGLHWGTGSGGLTRPSSVQFQTQVNKSPEGLQPQRQSLRRGRGLPS